MEEGQLSMELVIPEVKIKKLVKQHWKVTFARQKRTSVYTKKIIALVTAQIQDGDTGLRPYYQIPITDVVNVAKVDRNTAYKEVKKALRELTQQIWEFEDMNSHKYVPRHLIDTTKDESQDGFEFGYKSGMITFVFNPVLKPYFIELSHYTTYALNDYMKFKSWYSMRIYEILEAHRDTGKWFVNIDEYRILMDCEDKYPQTKDLISKTLKEPLAELKGTRMEFDYKPIHPKEKSKGRPPVIALEFVLKNPELRRIPKHWKDDEKNVRMIDALKEFKISEKNIARYGPYIPAEEVWKVLKSWREKEKSNDRINDKLRYCNKVFVTIGKKFEEELAAVRETINASVKPTKKGKAKKSPKQKRYVADETEMRELYEGGSWKDKATFEGFMEKHGYKPEGNEWVKYH